MRLTVGADGRNRTLLSPFASRTGRNQPSPPKFIFGAPAWIRRLIKPEPGQALAYCDWSQQEFAIAAALSEDENMLQAYRSGDPYISFAIQAGAAPVGATKQTHAEIREVYKTVVIAVGYQMGEESLAGLLQCSRDRAADLMDHHKRVFRRYWEWSFDVHTTGTFAQHLATRFDWKVRTNHMEDKERSIRNWPVQANGAEMMRIAVVLAHRRGVRVLAPVHDALLVEAAAEDIDEAVRINQWAMADASRYLLLDKLTLRTEALIVRHPQRFIDQRGTAVWKSIRRILHDQTKRYPSDDD